MDVEVIVSPVTNKKILDDGLRTSLDEACLPVKLFFGHVLALADRVDYLFVPRLISVEPKAYICPKFMGIPDMLKARIPQLPPLIDAAIDMRRSKNGWKNFFEEVGQIFTKNRALIKKAYKTALKADAQFQSLLNKGFLPPEVIFQKNADEVGVPLSERYKSLKIGLLGHAYNLYDSYISMNLIEKLRNMGASVITSESLPWELIEEQASKLPKRLFWTLGKRMIGSALTFFEDRNLDGIIYLSSFGCGPESLVGELIERWAKRQKDVPFMLLTLDEHSGEAGLVTRLEAFIEMIRWRKKNESHLSSHGQLVYRH